MGLKDDETLDTKEDAAAGAAEAGVASAASYVSPSAPSYMSSLPSGMSPSPSGMSPAASGTSWISRRNHTMREQLARMSAVSQRVASRAELMNTSMVMRAFHGDDKEAKAAFEGKATWPEVSVHLVTTMLGAGVLSLPYAFACLSWAGGVPILLAVTIASSYGAWLLATLHQLRDGRRTETLNELAFVTLGKYGRIYAFVFQFFILFFSCVTFMVLGGESLLNLYYSCYGASSSCAGNSHEQWPFVLIFAGAMIILGQLPNFHSLTIVSLIGSVMPIAYTLIACISILVGGKMENVSYARLTGDSTFESAMYFLQGMGSLLFAFGGQVVQNEVTATLKVPPPIKTSMRKSLTLTYGIITVCYFAMSCIGYAYYGNANVGNVMSLVPYKGAAIAANIGVLLHVGAGFQVLSMPVFMEVEKALHKQPWTHGKTPWVVRLVWRTAYIAFLAFLGALIPFFAQLGGLVGGLGVLPLCYALPILMWDSYNREEASKLRRNLHLALLVLIFCSAIAASIASVYFIIQQASDFQVFP